MAERPSKIIRLHIYEDRDGRTQKKWKDTGIVAWHMDSPGKYRLDVGAHITLVPGDAYMLVPQEDREDGGGRGGSRGRGRDDDEDEDRGRGGREQNRNLYDNYQAPAGEEIADDDIPF